MLESTEQAAEDSDTRARLLAEARRQYQAGAVAQAWETCAHVAGLSNGGIAARLTLSERAVENHVSHILRKLACSSRAGVASWYATSG